MKYYNLKIEKSEDTERMVDFIKSEKLLGSTKAVFMTAVAEMYQKMTKYRTNKYIDGVKKERIQGSVVNIDDQINLCLALPEGVVSGDMCQYATFNDLTGAKYVGTRPLKALNQDFVDDINSN